MTTQIEAAKPGSIKSTHSLVACTLGDMLTGNEGVLPHGFLSADGAPTPFTFRAPNMGTRKKLGALAGRKDLATMPGKHTCFWLATALKSLGGIDHDDGKTSTHAARVAQLCMGDIMFLLFAWQAYSRPKGMALTATGCGVCGEAFDSVLVDLRTLEVLRLPRAGDVDEEGAALAVATLEAPPTSVVGLYNGFPLGGGTVQTVLVRPPTWAGTMYKAGRGQMANNALLRALTLQDEICGVDSGPAVRMPMGSIDELWPDDVLLIDEAAGEITPTPILEIEVACPACQAKNRTVLDWQEPAFLQGS